MLREEDNTREFFETILDNMVGGAYVLDDAGNYIYVNSAYVGQNGMDKSTFDNFNVHEFVSRKQIDVCISDIVYREKRRVVMLQDVSIAGRDPYRQLVISTPLFGEDGKIKYVLAICRPLDAMNDLLREASATGVQVAHFVNSGRRRSSFMVAESPAMRNVLKQVEEVASIDAAVLITGESGTGKEVVAKMIHDMGRGQEGEMITLNCAALPENLLESELFGYEKGAFTGASPHGKVGLLEAAGGGTLFLDEINSIPITLQGKLLRALETKTVQRIGSVKSKSIDFRLITATNESLLDAIAEKRFRADLYYRISVVPIEIPPLRNRREDIVPLAMLFLDRYNAKYNKSKTLSTNTLNMMLGYEWPGNVRELKNFVERSVIMSVGNRIDMTDIHGVAGSHAAPKSIDPDLLGPIAPLAVQDYVREGLSLEEYMDRCEREFLTEVFKTYKTSHAAARYLGTSQSSVMRRKKKYGL